MSNLQTLLLDKQKSKETVIIDQQILQMINDEIKHLRDVKFYTSFQPQNRILDYYFSYFQYVVYKAVNNGNNWIPLTRRDCEDLMNINHYDHSRVVSRVMNFFQDNNIIISQRNGKGNKKHSTKHPARYKLSNQFWLSYTKQNQVTPQLSIEDLYTDIQQPKPAIKDEQKYTYNDALKMAALLVNIKTHLNCNTVDEYADQVKHITQFLKIKDPDNTRKVIYQYIVDGFKKQFSI